MVKSIIKEIIIMLLLCVAILLILGVLFYDYIPSNKAIPSKIAYSTPENIQDEINEEITEFNTTNITYSVTDADLNIYKQSNSYVPGKRDPFSMGATQAEENTSNGQTSGTINNNGEVTNNNEEIVETNTNSDPNSTGTFFNETGKK